MWLHVICVLTYSSSFIVGAIYVSGARAHYPETTYKWVFAYQVYALIKAMFDFFTNLILLYLMNEFSIIINDPTDSRSTIIGRHDTIESLLTTHNSLNSNQSGRL